MYRPRTTNEWLFVGTATAQAVSTTGLDLYVLLTFIDWINPVAYQGPSSYVVPLNFGLFVLGSVYQAVLALDTLRTKNNLQLYSIGVIDFSLLIFSVMRFFQIEKVSINLPQNWALGGEPFAKPWDYWARVQFTLLISITIIGICSVVACVMIFLLQREFRWAIYRHISGSLQMRRRFLAYQTLLVLIRVEAYFFVGFALVYGFINVHYAQPEFSLTMALIPALFIMIALNIFSIKRENYLSAVIVIVLRLLEMAYLLSRILVLTGHSLLAKTILKDEQLFYAGVALGFATLACLNTMLCVVNFNKGLKPLLQNYTWEQTPHEFEPVHQHRYAERIDLD